MGEPAQVDILIHLERIVALQKTKRGVLATLAMSVQQKVSRRR